MANTDICERLNHKKFMIKQAPILSPELRLLKNELLTEIKNLLTDRSPVEKKPWLRSSEVRKMLAISPGTLYNLKNQKVLVPSKINGTYYYAYEDVMQLLTKERN